MAFTPRGSRLKLPPIEGRTLFENPEYSSVIFFENSMEQKRYIAESCSTVRFVNESLAEAEPNANFIVVNIQETEPVPNVPFDELPFKEQLGDNEYVEKYNLRERSDRFDARSGIQQYHYDNILKPWISSRKLGTHIAVFDWDRTITVVEGLFLSDEIIEDTLNYVCGGILRVNMLKDMFRKLREANIHIMILTNNTGGHTPKFNSLITALVGANQPAYSIVVSYDPPYNGIKANAFSKLKGFSQLGCRAPPTEPVVRSLLPGAKENLEGPRNAANNEVASYFGFGGTRRRRRSKTLRRMLRRMLRSKRTKRCGKSRRKLL